MAPAGTYLVPSRTTRYTLSIKLCAIYARQREQHVPPAPGKVFHLATTPRQRMYVVVQLRTRLVHRAAVQDVYAVLPFALARVTQPGSSMPNVAVTRLCAPRSAAAAFLQQPLHPCDRTFPVFVYAMPHAPDLGPLLPDRAPVAHVPMHQVLTIHHAAAGPARITAGRSAVFVNAAVHNRVSVDLVTIVASSPPFAMRSSMIAIPSCSIHAFRTDTPFSDVFTITINIHRVAIVVTGWIS